MSPEHAGTEVAPEPRELGPEQVVAEFERLFYESAQDTWQTVTWMGVAAQKLPLDLWVLQEIVFETRPGLIVEAGVHRGGTTLFYASLLDLIGEGQVIGIDVDISKVDERVRSHPRVSLVEGSSVAPEVLARVQAAARGRRVMVDLDSEHGAAHVLGELRRLSPLVSPGCYLVVEDTNLNGNPVREDFGPGPAEALEEWLRSDPPFDVDRARERLLLTFNPSGYLRRRGGDRPAASTAPLAFERPAAGPIARAADHDLLAQSSEVSPAQAEARLAELVGSGRRVLDLRAGDGSRARQLAQARCSVVGIEPDPDAAKLAAQSCERMVVGDLEGLDFAAEFGDERFDVILAVDALERLRSPERVLETVRARLNADGHLVAAVGNVAHARVRLALLGGEFPAEGEAVAADQTRFFTLASIERSLEQAGFAIGEIVREVEQLDAAELPGELLGVSGLQALLQDDPDARTRRFLIAAYPVARPELKLQLRRVAALAHQVDVARREAAGVPHLVRRVEEAESEVARLQALVDQQAPEIESLRSSVLASSARVGELGAALERARTMLEIRDRQPSLADAETLAKLGRMKRRLDKRKKTLEEIAPLLERLARIESSLPFRVYSRLARPPGLRRLRARKRA